MGVDIWNIYKKSWENTSTPNHN